MRISYKDYYEPTPKNIRKWADGLLGVSTFMTASLIYCNCKGLAISSLIVGVLGKVISNFFSEDVECKT